MQIQVSGLNELNGYLRNLSPRLRKSISRESEQFMLDVRKSAKLRAPRDTKGLKDSIHVELTGANEWTLFVDSPHGVFQEEGFKPHWIHSDMIKGSNKLKGEGFFFVSKSKPFVAPALETNLSKLDNRLSHVTDKAMRGSR